MDTYNHEICKSVEEIEKRCSNFLSNKYYFIQRFHTTNGKLTSVILKNGPHVQTLSLHGHGWALHKPIHRDP